MVSGISLPDKGASEAHYSSTRVTRTAALLGLFFVSLYLFTMSGHTSSSDEEIGYYITRSLAEHGGFEVPNDPTIIGGVPPNKLGTNNYLVIGIVPSVMAAPLYMLGDQVARWLPWSYHEYLARLFTGALDPVVTAATCVLLFLFAVELGYPVQVGRALALAFGLTTLAWPYSKYFWREPVFGFWLLASAYVACLTTRRCGVLGLALAGIALGLALGSKIAALIAVPVVLAYEFAPFLIRRWRLVFQPGRVCLAIGSLLLAGIPLAVGDVLRFGDPMVTISTRIGAPLAATGVMLDLRRAVGIAGLLASPGKSIFLYSPITVLGILGLRHLWSRRPREAALFGLLAVGQIVAAGWLHYWHGDTAWGPRLLVPIVPFLVLPIGATLSWSRPALRRVARRTFVGLAVVGFGIQLSAVLVCYLDYATRDTGTFGARGEELRWDPRTSPVVWQWRILGERLASVQAWQPSQVILRSGFHQAEGPPGAVFPRWTDGRADLAIAWPAARAVHVEVDFSDYRPLGWDSPKVALAVNGTLLPDSALQVVGSAGWRTLSATIGTAALANSATFEHQPLELQLVSETWIPGGVTDSLDQRRLGISIRDVRIQADGRALSVGSPLVPYPPITNDYPWTNETFFWFVNGENQLLDIWPWFLYFSGLPRPLVLAALLPVAGFAVACVLLLRDRDDAELAPVG